MSSRCPAQTLSTEVPSAVLTLDPVTDPTVVGFRVYFGAGSGQYSQMIDVGNATTATLSGLSAGETYFFVVTAYNVFGLESVPSSEVSFTVPAIGTIPPLFSFIPGAQTATASPGGFAAVPDVVSLTTVTDSVGVTSLTQSPLAGASIGVGSYPIVLTATDAAGNTATATVPFTVTPAVAPQFTFVPGAQTATANASGFAFVPEVVSLTTAAAVYYNVGVTSLTQSPLADASVGVGSYTIVLTATDSAGNSTTANVPFTVNPPIGPQFTSVPGAQTATVSVSGFALIPDVVSLTTVTDDVNVTSLTQSPPAGASVGAGSYTIVLTATDAAGNSTTANVPFTVNPGIPPQFTVVPGAQTATASLSGVALVPDLVSLTTATDGAGITSLTQSPLAGASVGVGSYTIVLTAIDAAGNSATANVPFTVIPAAPIAVADSAVLTSAAPITLNVLANDAAPLGYTLTVASVTRPSLGDVVINANNTITYTPRATFATFAGTDSFTYTISDGVSGSGGMATATVTVGNPFYRIKGSYGGLLAYSSGASTSITGGYLTLTLTGTGGLTGSLRLSGVAYGFSSAFNASGAANVSIKRAGKPSITLALSLDLASGSTISGTASDGSTAYAVNTGARELYNSLTNPDPSAGAYTVLLPAPPAPSGAAAVATAVVAAGKIVGFTLSSGGGGYVTTPRAVIAGTSGTGATAAAIVNGGSVTGIKVMTAGAGYSAGGTSVTIDPPSAGLPQGTGWATMNVAESGAVTVIGRLGDGTAFSAGAFMVQGSNDAFPFYAPLYAVPGIIAGMMTFEDLAESDCDGTLTWVKPAQTASGLYRSGFSTSISFQGARYAALPKTQVLDFTNPTAGVASFQLSLGNLASPIDHMLSISNLNVVTVTDASEDNLKLAISPATGAFTGSFLANPTTSHTATTISGVIYQKTNSAAGLFLGASQAGNVVLTPE